MQRRCFFWTIVLAAVFFASPSAWAAKNVILMITDGGGYNQWLAASMYQGRVGRQLYDQPGWVRWSACTYPLNLFFRPTGNDRQLPFLVYDPAKAWDATPSDDPSGMFAGYVYLTTTYTDSAAAATALASGQKTYNHAINWSNEGKPLRGQTIAEIAKSQGKSVGVVTSVPWSHATPAGLGGAHNISRDHYAEIAREMLGAAWLDVMMGAGNPDFDDNGKPLSATQRHDYKYVGGQDAWTALKSGKLAWKLIEKKSDFESLTSGTTPAKLVGAAQVGSTLQEKRGGAMTHVPYDHITKDPDAKQLSR
ncbi:MAG: alkaline phosphatase, partial [Thermoguttaceae bacterium]